MTRLLKASAIVLVIVLAVFLFSGCGGEETPAVTKASTSKSSKSTPSSGAAGSNRAENQVGQVIVGTEQTPPDFTRSLESRRPIVITFYMTGPYDDSQVRSFISTLESHYRGEVDFYDYLITDGQRYGDLSTLLMVNESPTVVCINRQAQIVRAWTGYVDAKTLEQGIVEALK